MRHPVFTAFVCAVCAVLAVPAWATLHSENALSTDVIIPNQHHVSPRTNLLLVSTSISCGAICILEDIILASQSFVHGSRLTKSLPRLLAEMLPLMVYHFYPSEPLLLTLVMMCKEQRY